MSQRKKAILDQIKQHKALPIMVRLPHNTPFSEEIVKGLNEPVRQGFYSLMVVIKGESKHMVDFKNHTITDGQLLFATPWQIHAMEKTAGTESYGTSFGEELMNYIPSSFPFFTNPFENQIIEISQPVLQRLVSVFHSLDNILQDEKSNPELILVYLNALLTECNSVYFKDRKPTADAKDSLSSFILFKNYLEDKFLNHPPVEEMAEQLGINTNALYHLVKTQCGISPKTYLTERLILEAKRKLYIENISIKELAYDLNYNDPEYFSRLFKKHTGKSISEYRKHIQDLSGS